MPERNILDVITAVIAVIPHDHAVQPQLQALAQDALYTAPELMPALWDTLCIILNSGLPAPGRFGSPTWTATVQRIVSGGAEWGYERKK